MIRVLFLVSLVDEASQAVFRRGAGFSSRGRGRAASVRIASEPTPESPMTSRLQNDAVRRFLAHARIVETPLICGPMYLQQPERRSRCVGRGRPRGWPISLTYVHGHDFREGLRLIFKLSGGKPIGLER